MIMPKSLSKHICSAELKKKMPEIIYLETESSLAIVNNAFCRMGTVRIWTTLPKKLMNKMK